MKTFITLLSLLVLGFSLNAAETPAKKKAAQKKAPAAEGAKPSAKVEAIAKTLTSSQRTKLLGVLNEGDDKALTAMPGVGETRAAAIKKARPFADVTDVMKVEGIGDTTFAEMVAHAKEGYPDKKEAAKPEPAAEKKKAPAKKKEAPKKKDSKDAK